MANLSNINNKFLVTTGGNVLIGKTAANNATVGTQIMSTGDINPTVSGDTVARFNRLGTDGEIIRFQHDTSTDGAINSSAGRIAIGSGDTGIFFDSIRQVISGHNMTTNSYASNIDLGRSIIPFQNLYLSGNITAGGYIKLGGYSYIGEDLTEQDSLTIASDSTESIYFAHYNQSTSTYTTTVQIDPSGNVMLDVNNWLQGHVTVGGGTQNLIRSRAMGYPGYYGCQIGQETNHIALFIDPNSVAGGAFSGNVNELMLPNKVIFQQANAVANPTDWLNGQSITLDNAKVGIGTTSPNYKLSVANASTRIVSINYQDSLNTIMSHAGSPNYGLEALTIRGDYIAFYTDYDPSHYQGLERMRIDSSGNVGIGRANPDSLIQIEARNSSNVIYAGLRVGYNQTSNNYYDADTHHFRLGTGSAAGGNLMVGGGIYLGGTGNSNKLTHYEKGIWTPVIAHHDGTGVIPSTMNQAAWVRVGSLVTLSAYITGINPNGNAGGSGAYYGFKGFPYNPSSLSTWNMVYVGSAITSYGGYMSSASMYFNIINANGTNGAGHASGAVVNSWGSNWACMISATYVIA